ncbi:MAG: SIS domain-containing protein [Ignavibacteriaceae bacterium]|nr:SIS domain-containing protein [Ignavibacteriaceae bacterium]
MNKFLTEILGQPKSLKLTLDYYLSEAGENRLNDIKKLLHKEEFKQIIFTGMGSSYFSSYAASCLFNNLGIHAYVINTSELLYYHSSLITEKTLVICISQSGESFEVVKLIKELPSNFICIGVTNEEQSFLSKNAKESLLSRAGKEEMTSTKTFTSLNLVLFILGWYIADKWGKDKINEISKVITNVEMILDGREKLVNDLSAFLGDLEYIQFIGRGPSYANVQQSELMFKEAAKLPSAVTLGGEFRHGPMEMVSDGFKSVLFAADGTTYNQNIKMATDIAKYDGKVILITNKDPKLSDKNIKVVSIKQTSDEYLFTIQSIIPVQLMVLNIALSKGLEPGNFIHGGKVTVIE